MTDEKRLQDQMQAHEDRDRVRELTRYDPHPQDYDDARTTPHGFTGADLSDFHASEAPMGEVAADRLSEPLRLYGPWADAVAALIEAVQAPVIERAERAEDERDEVAGRLSALLDDLTGGLLSKPTYPVEVMVREIEDYFERLAREEAPSADAATGLRESPAEAPTRERMEALIEKSSLGTPEAKRLRDSVPREAVDRIMARVRELDAEAPEPSGDVVERAAQVIYQREYRTAVSEAYSQDSPGVRFAWSHARTLARTLADAGLLADPEDERRWDDAYDWFGSELESVRGERDAAEARARRAEDALREVRDKLTYAVKPCSNPGCGYCMERREAVNPALTVANAALSAADQTSDATPSDGGERGE